MLPPFGPIEGLKWLDQISSQWESQKNRFAFISFGKSQFKPPIIWDQLFTTTVSAWEGAWMAFLAWQHLPSTLQSIPLVFLPSILFSSLVTLQLSIRVQSLPGSWYIKVAFWAEALKYLHRDRTVSPLHFQTVVLIFFIFNCTTLGCRAKTSE